MTGPHDRPEPGIVSDRYVVSPASRGLLLDLGVSPTNVLRRASLPADLLARTPSSMAAEEFHAFWVALEQETADPNLPITVARALRTEVFHPPIFAALCSPNLQVAAERIAAHKQLMGPIRLAVEASSDGLRLAPRWPAGMQVPSVLVNMELLFWVALARIATRADVRPRAMTVPQLPADPDAYRDYLGMTARRDDAPSITFSRMDAVRAFLTADDVMWEFFAPELRRRLSELDDRASTTDRVHAVLLELLPAGGATMQGVARELAVSSRTLQRRLREEGTTFQTILTQTRESLARHYLTESTMPTAEISFLLGYEDTNSFYRAFQSWTGKTPQHVRQAAFA